jgi:hypothetical protein
MSTERRLASSPFLVAAAAVSLAVFSIWQSVHFAQENETLRGALSNTRSRAQAASSEPAPGSSAELQKTQADLEGARTRLRAAEAKAHELASALAIAPAEELKSLGRPEQLASEGIELLNTARQHAEAIRAATLEGQRGNTNLVMKDLPGLIVHTEAIGKLEANPGEVAELHAQALRQMLGLDETTSRRVRESLAAEFELLRKQGLDRPQRPIEGQEDWYARRDRMLLDAAARIEALIPSEKRWPNAVSQIMNLSTAFRSRMMRSPDGSPGTMELFYEEPGSEPIQVEAKL